MFYLVLRGLDTIEDDMHIPLDKKVPLLRNFHKTMLEDGWQYHGSTEKDKELLEKFDVVVTELKKIGEQHRDIIQDIAEKMGNGMADYVENDDMIKNGVKTIEEYELYCHYVAGLVGAGLTGLFLASDLAHPKLAERPNLTESMGQFLQKTNIIRDIHEDWQDGRRWYPREIWSKHVDKWEDMFDPKYREQAMNVISEMILNALNNVEECLFYMAGMKDQSVFNFVAIPQGMAIATLEACFRNPDVLERNVKITKGQACQIMLDSTQNLQVECDVFRKYVRLIHAKNDPRDPNFLNISVQCAKVRIASIQYLFYPSADDPQIEQFIETLYPRQNAEKLAAENKLKKNKEPTTDPGEAAVIFLVAIACLVFITAIMIGVAWLFGAQFGNMLSDITATPVGGAAKSAASSLAHEEL